MVRKKGDGDIFVGRGGKAQRVGEGPTVVPTIAMGVPPPPPEGHKGTFKHSPYKGPNRWVVPVYGDVVTETDLNQTMYTHVSDMTGLSHFKESNPELYNQIIREQKIALAPTSGGANMFDDDDISQISLGITPQVSWADNSLSGEGDKKMPARNASKKKKHDWRSSNTWNRQGAPSIGRRTGYRTARLNVPSGNIRGFLYPHANSKPRIMDGATASSQVSYHKTIRQVTIPAGKSGVIVLTNNLLSIVDYVLDTTDNTVNSLVNTVDHALDLSGITSTSGLITRSGDVDQWRMVSRGLRMSFLNTSDNNDGWFEAYRLTDNLNVDDVKIMKFTDGSELGFMQPVLDCMERYYNNKEESVIRPSYVADSLKCVGKYYFKLNPFGDEHPFTELVKNFRIDDTGVTYATLPVKTLTFNGNASHSVRPIINALHDTTFDQVCIVIHAGASDANILLDVASNIEVVYDNDSILAKFHTKTQENEAAHQTLHKITSAQVPAGISVSSA